MIVLMSNRRKNTAHLWMIWFNPNQMLGSSPMADSTPESNKHISALVCERFYSCTNSNCVSLHYEMFNTAFHSTMQVPSCQLVHHAYQLFLLNSNKSSKKFLLIKDYSNLTCFRRDLNNISNWAAIKSPRSHYELFSSNIKLSIHIHFIALYSQGPFTPKTIMITMLG